MPAAKPRITPDIGVTEPQAGRLKAGHPIVVPAQLVAGDAGDGATVKVLSSGALVALARRGIASA